jgi:hypothetical protein
MDNEKELFEKLGVDRYLQSRGFQKTYKPCCGNIVYQKNGFDVSVHPYATKFEEIICTIDSIERLIQLEKDLKRIEEKNAKT